MAKFKQFINPIAFSVVFATLGVVLLFISRAAGTYSPPSNIATNCSVDVTSALNNWINTVPNSSTLLFKAGACYRIDGTLNVNSRSNLVFDGQGATFKAVTTGDRTRSQWSADSSSGITFKNMIIRGANPNAGFSEEAYVGSLEAQHAFNIVATRGVVIQNNQAYDLYGDFVYFGNRSSKWSGNAWVANNHFERNGRQGLSVVGGDHILITGNTFKEVRRTMFDLEPNTSTGGATDITIDKNTIGRSRLNFLSSHGASGKVNAITISNNTLTGDSMVIDVLPPTGSRRSNFKIINNTSNQAYGTPSGSVYNLTSVDNIEFRNNTQPLQVNRSMYGAKLTNTTGVVITGNTFTNGVGTYKGTGNAITTNCGNRFTSTGSFNKPIACPTTQPPPATAPQVSITSPINNATVAGTVSIVASASDAKGIASVQFLVNGNSLATDTNSPYTVEWDTKSIPDGTYSLTAIAKNTQNLSTTSSAISVTVSNQSSSGNGTGKSGNGNSGGSTGSTDGSNGSSSSGSNIITKPIQAAKEIITSPISGVKKTLAFISDAKQPAIWRWLALLALVLFIVGLIILILFIKRRLEDRKQNVHSKAVIGNVKANVVNLDADSSKTISNSKLIDLVNRIKVKISSIFKKN